MLYSPKVNSGLSFPKGSRGSNCSIKSKLRASEFSLQSIFRLRHGITPKFFAKLLMSFLNLFKSSHFNSKPAAKGWPPNRTKYLAQVLMASYKENPSILLHDPLATTSIFEMTIVGLPYFSNSLAATIPITPGCQFSPSTIKTL